MIIFQWILIIVLGVLFYIAIDYAGLRLRQERKTNRDLLKALHDYRKEAEETIAEIRNQSQIDLDDKIQLQIKNAKLAEAIHDYRTFTEATIAELKTKVEIRDQQIKNTSNN